MKDRKLLRPHLRTASDPRAIRTREALRLSLLKLLDQRPLDQITIADICELGNVSYTTFFRYHSTKESLLNDIAADEMRKLVTLAQTVADTSDSTASSIALWTYVDEHRKLWTTLLTGGAAGAMRDEFLRLSMEIMLQSPPRDNWPPADIAVLLIAASTLELLGWWLRDPKPLPIEQVAEIHVHVIIAPAVRQAPPRVKKANIPRRTPKR